MYAKIIYDLGERMFHEYNFTLDSLYIVANALLFILAKWKNHYIYSSAVYQFRECMDCIKKAYTNTV